MGTLPMLEWNNATTSCSIESCRRSDQLHFTLRSPRFAHFCQLSELSGIASVYLSKRHVMRWVYVLSALPPAVLQAMPHVRHLDLTDCTYFPVLLSSLAKLCPQLESLRLGAFRVTLRRRHRLRTEREAVDALLQSLPCLSHGHVQESWEDEGQAEVWPLLSRIPALLLVALERLKCSLLVMMPHLRALGVSHLGRPEAAMWYCVYHQDVALAVSS